VLRNPCPLNDYLVYRGRPRPDLPARFGEGGLWQEPRQLRIVKAAAPDRLGDPVVGAALEQQEGIGEEVPRKSRPMPIGKEAGVTSSASACSISSNRSNGSRPSLSS
jgi:hypothetical protein